MTRGPVLRPLVLSLALSTPLAAQPARATRTVATESTTAPSRESALDAMKRATAFMTQRVAYRGGYVWVVSDDLATRWGEVPARPTQVWVQAATPMMGETFLDAYEATSDPTYLAAARSAVDVLVFGQHPLGGFHYFIDFDPAGLAAWYAARASKFRFGYEEYRQLLRQRDLRRPGHARCRAPAPASTSSSTVPCVR